VQYNGGRTAVAARFTGEVANWIVKPELLNMIFKTLFLKSGL
jgi:hypothetical protein